MNSRQTHQPSSQMQSASGSWCVLTEVRPASPLYLDTLPRTASTFVSIKGNQEAGS